MSDKDDLNERGNHQGHFTQGVGGWAEYTVMLTGVDDKIRHDITPPPGKVIPIIFLPGVMGSNLRMSKARQSDERLDRDDNRAWRPDDLMSGAGKFDVLTGFGMGNWFKNATPAQRQLALDPNETEVDYYEYTESVQRFDPEGKETLASDARHQNVPDSLRSIPPLLGFWYGNFPVRHWGKRTATPAQVARWRGWSEVLFEGAYGTMLRTTEHFMNNILVRDKLDIQWHKDLISPHTGKRNPKLRCDYKDISELLTGDPKRFGAEVGESLDEGELRKVAKCWYPVHAMGYNFLQSNGESAKAIAQRIRGLVKGYQKRHFKCDEVIIVSHSMGGLVARALLHPSYGNMLADPAIKILGVHHNVMPTTGAASAYKRMRFGFLDKPGKLANIQAKVIAINGEHATAVLANAPGPLELLPGEAYGKRWLKVVDAAGKDLWSWPPENETALASIYLKSPDQWWRLVNPDWVNPAKIPAVRGGGYRETLKRIEDATTFLESIRDTFHPAASYASYCSSKALKTYGEVVFKTQSFLWNPSSNKTNSIIAPPDTWKLLADDRRGKLTVQAGDQKLFLILQRPTAAGDETVPSDRSARACRGRQFRHDGSKDDSYEHQDSFASPAVLASLLYSIVQAAKTAKWE